jgi:phosphatidate cytidylyltransferase
MRLLSALAGIPLVLLLAWWGGLAFFLLILFISHLALLELYKLLGVKGKKLRLSGLAGNLLLLLTVFALPGTEAYLLALTVFFLGTFTMFWLSSPGDFLMLASVMFGKLYITTPLCLFLLIRSRPDGFSLVLLLLLAVWATDTGAYFFGLSFGRRPLAPLVSPRKSVEGALGGLVTALLVLSVAAPYLGLTRIEGISLGFILSVSGQAGDMAESALKRWAEAKDSGSFLPGHGGVLDRLDSLLFALPVAFIYLTLFS